ncbi:hypothetical protein NPIL_39191 [Nephila pilipes]|uniref:Uncharacterized protein n=1 Tax=Nephila pilipes TaxID=299642 RepID=A0A8X6QL23_NEPPI|nr:hypothetical protein NPIL_39191 [Nephila pilipes]
MCSVLNIENTIGYKWMKDVNKEKYVSLKNRLVFRHNPGEDYILSRHVLIGKMTVVCPCCKALKFSGETKGMCCADGKIKLTQFREPPEH